MDKPKLDLNPTRLTEFPQFPEPEEEQPGFTGFFSKFLRFSNKSETQNNNSTQQLENISEEITNQNITEERSFPNILKRISNLVALKNSNLQSYNETELRQYWMPDNVARECYECSEKFTTWRRKHHCRLCGRIFCSKCCFQEIPGKIVGCTGSLRVCTYCCNVVLSYLESSNSNDDLSPDLKQFQEDLQSKLGQSSSNSSSIRDIPSSLVNYSNSSNNLNSMSNDNNSILSTRKVSLGYQEENFFANRSFNPESQNEERYRTLQRSSSLRALYESVYSATQTSNERQNSDKTLSLSTHKYKYRNYIDCFTGSQLVDWLINHNKVENRIEATALGQALLECGYIENVAESPNSFQVLFSDSNIGLYRPKNPLELNSFDFKTESNLKKLEELAEPPWVQQITLSDSDNQLVDATTTSSKLTTSSSFYLDLDLHSNTVHLVKPKENKGIVKEKNLQIDNDDDSSNIEPSGGLQTTVDQQKISSSSYLNQNQLYEDEDVKLLETAWKQHENALLAQFLNEEGLPHHWSTVIQKLVREAVSFIRPNLNHDLEQLDIREYVRIKTVSEGLVNDCCVVRGIVCTKNVAHRKMQQIKLMPKILLVACPLVYQRNEGKLMTLEPVMMQENEYLRNTTSRILSLNPDVVLVGRNATRLAQEYLGEAGVILATNVKISILKRLARASQADVINSIDAANVARGSWRLATCHKFYTKQFKIKNGVKTLMFFEGLLLPHLAATILLRGAPLSELKRLKRVAQKHLFAYYNWRLERSFLIDVCAKPPLNEDIFLHSIAPSKENSPDNVECKKSDSNLFDKNPVLFEKLNNKPLFVKEDKIDDNSIFENSNEKIDVREEFENEKNQSNLSKKFDDVSTKIDEVTCKNLENDTIIQISITDSDKSSESENKQIVIENIDSSTTAFKDPLQNSTEENLFNTEIFTMSEVKSNMNQFRKILDDTILSISPFLKFQLPYLESELGKKCEIRKYFPEILYYSKKFESTNNNDQVKMIMQQHETKINNNLVFGDHFIVEKQPKHEFVLTQLKSPASSVEVQNLLALYRAIGGTYNLKSNQNGAQKQKYESPKIVDNRQNQKINNELLNQETISNSLDVFNFENHQNLQVLFCSFNAKVTNDAPTYCVNPRVIDMEFYGKNDTTLGCYLERYCFRDKYVCPSEKCDTPMLYHIRRFVHQNGCVQIMLNKLDQNVSQDNQIVTWSWCSECNELSSPFINLSEDTWSLSFAKFLEMKFHAPMYVRRNNCSHSLHQKCHQYFGLNNIAASFIYTPIKLWEISIPPTTIDFIYEQSLKTDLIIDEIRVLSLKGHEIYSLILEKIIELLPQEETSELKQLLQKDQANFKSKIEEIQLKLTSPTFDRDKRLNLKKNLMEIQFKKWELDNSLVLIKRLIMEAYDTWNTRLVEIHQTKNSSKKTSTPSQQQKNELIQSTKNSILSVLSDEIEGLNPNESGEIDKLDETMTLDLNAVDIVASTTTQYIFDNNQLKCDFELSDDECSINQFKCESDSEKNLLNQSCSDGIEKTSNYDEKKLLEIPSDKKSMKTILTQFLQPNSFSNIIQSPFATHEHYLLPFHKCMPIIIYENEISSIISYALTTIEYQNQLKEYIKNKNLSIDSNNGGGISPLSKRKLFNSGESENTSNLDSLDEQNDLSSKQQKSYNLESGIKLDPSALLNDSINRKNKFDLSNKNESTTNQIKFDVTQQTKILESTKQSAQSKTEQQSAKISNQQSSGKIDSAKLTNYHIDIEFKDKSAKFLCRIYYAGQFMNFRKLVLFTSNDADVTNNSNIDIWEEKYLRSLSRSLPWAAKGGKSGTSFLKTKDDRFILKEMTKLELQMFLDAAPNYFQYMNKCLNESQPTLLGKIVGVYAISFRNTNVGVRKNFLVMENLFYNRNVKQKYDLKGSDRNRLVNANDLSDENVLLDENFIKMAYCKSPLYLRYHSKNVLLRAINNDTEFLASQSVMDYSLLVGLDEDSQQLVIGIIDYIRTFTWDKKIETIVKKSGFLGGQGKLPTIVSPHEYRNRFIDAMHRYFLHVPDRWAYFTKLTD